ncbi:ATP-binding protein [Spirillospora sp. NPDC048911]|uniref:ATP-binding protein n=1 Tax=Spirillospora sp. NPDC048911 TaxID=3364527 RepID=UPI0037179C16
MERSIEFSVLDDLLEKCATGTAQVAVIDGPVACGKTALLNTFAERAVEAGALVLSAAGAHAERHLSLGVLDQLMRNVESADGAAGRELPPLDRALIDAVARPEPDATEQLASPTLRDLLGRLQEVAKERPIIICVDDVEYVDDLSLRCLLYLVRRLRSHRVMVVLTEHSGLRGRHQILEADLLRQPYCRRIRLEPLSPFAVGTLLSQRMGRLCPRRLATAFHGLTGGNPLLTTALLDDSFDPAHEMDSPAPVPGEAFQAAVVRCLCWYEQPELDVARAIAVFGEPVPPGLLGAALGHGHQTVEEAIKSLADAGLVCGLGFRHEKARLAVLQTIAAADRKALHAEAARVLHAAGAHASVVAEHLLSADGPGAPWRSEVLSEAAEHALEKGDSDRAVLLLRLAQQQCADDRERAVLSFLIARAEWRIAPSNAERLLPELTAAARQGLLGERYGAQTIDYLAWHGRLEGAAQVLSYLRTREGRDSEQAAQRLAFLYPHTVSSATFVADSTSETFAPRLSMLPLPEGGPDEVIMAAEQVLQRARLEESALISVTAALLGLVYCGSLDKAVFWCESLAAEAEARRARAWTAILAAVGAWAEIRRGDLRAAHRRSAQALTGLSPESWGVAFGLPVASMVTATMGLGNLDRAGTYLDAPVPKEMFDTRVGLHYLHARGWHHMAMGRFHAALGDFQVCGGLMVRWNLDVPAITPWRSAAAHAYTELGRLDKGRVLAEEQLAMLPAWDHRTRGLTLRALAGNSELKDRRPMLFEAVDALQKAQDKLGVAQALADLSRVQHELGEIGTARRTACRADHLAQASGAHWLRRMPLAVQAGRADIVTGEPADDGPIGELSDAELRVAALAADGFTNRQIANRLFVTVSTVEQHLTRVYRKLDVSRRADLSSAIPAARLGPAFLEQHS